MGEVFLARDSILGRQVAIKTILASSSFGEEAKVRFEREARATALLNHPNIVTVYEFGEQDGLHFLAMEYLEGETLESLIQSRGLDPAGFMEVLAQVCEGLSFAHEHEVVHRDVKPANVLVLKRGKRLTAKLMDFGVASMSQSNLTGEGTWMGTANYLAPEYLDSGKATTSSDLFAVGVMLYEVVTGGRKPFTGETATMVLNAILRKPPEPFLPEELQGAGPQLVALVRKALAKNPADRYANAELLAAAIREAAMPPARKAPEPPPRPAPPKPQAPVQEKPLVVGRGGGATCLSLRVALRMARPGSTIKVLPGVYRESLVVHKDVSILGDGDPAEIILESAQGPCLTMESPQVLLRGVTLRRSDPRETEPLAHVKSGRAAFEDCEFLAEDHEALRVEGAGTQVRLALCGIHGQPRTGLALGAGASAVISQCVVEGPRESGLRVDRAASAQLSRTVIKAGEGTGLRLGSGGQVQLEDCEILDCRAGGLEVETEGLAQLKRCRLASSAFAGVLAFERGQVTLEECEILEHAAAGLHAVEGARLTLRQCRLHDNGGFGLSVMDQALASLEGCEIDGNAQPGVFVHQGGTIQVSNSKIHDGGSLGVVCAAKGRGVLEGCEIFGNAQSGAKVESGGSLLLVRCILRDGRDTGMLLFEDSELTLEECVVHRNARGGILLAKDASDPILRGGNQIDDGLLRANTQGGFTRLAPVRKR